MLLSHIVFRVLILNAYVGEKLLTTKAVARVYAAALGYD